VTELLEQIIDALSQLPEDVQDTVARAVIGQLNQDAAHDI
jgi:hypothetical protein